MPHLVFAVTHPLTANRLLRGHLSFLRQRGYRVTVISSPGALLDETREREGVDVVAVPMEREITPLRDLRSLVGLRRAIGRLAPDLMLAGTPKAGLLGMLAARSRGVPARAYHLRGLRFETTRGLKRRILLTTEWLTARAASVVLANSQSLRTRFLEAGLASEGKVRVPGAGSANGIDPEQLEEGAGTPEDQDRLRAQLGLPDDAPVVGFVGRFVQDKGIVELLEAFDQVRKSLPACKLLLLGDFEEGDPVPAEVRERMRSDPAIVMPGFVPQPSAYYPLMDVLAFPSWREGMPNAPLEAAALGLPVVGARATGTVDAVVDGETGALVPVGKASALGGALLRYLQDPELRWRHGKAGRERVLRLFERSAVWNAWEHEYQLLLRTAGRRSVGTP